MLSHWRSHHVGMRNIPHGFNDLATQSIFLISFGSVDLKTIGITSKSATVQWSPPESNDGLELIGYVIEKRLVRDKWLKVLTLKPNILQLHVENLKEKSEYFKVNAENRVGLRPPAKTDLVKLKTHLSHRRQRPFGDTFSNLILSVKVREMRK